ncbi:MAG TPA: SRPBCC domain-containing protein [Rhizomicrobium sp.]|nr:SRPBCC domain-containing protein [Rhizomicrobium sp.]
MRQYKLTLTRLLDAPADTLFRCWTTPELRKQWFAPKPYSAPVIEIDLRPGGGQLEALAKTL